VVKKLFLAGGLFLLAGEAGFKVNCFLSCLGLSLAFYLVLRKGFFLSFNDLRNNMVLLFQEDGIRWEVF